MNHFLKKFYNKYIESVILFLLRTPTPAVFSPPDPYNMSLGQNTERRLNHIRSESYQTDLHLWLWIDRLCLPLKEFQALVG